MTNSSSCITVGTGATPRATIVSIRSSNSLAPRPVAAELSTGAAGRTMGAGWPRGVSREAAIAHNGVVHTGHLDHDSVSRDVAATDAARTSRPAQAEVLCNPGPGHTRGYRGDVVRRRRRGGLVTTGPSTDKAAALLALHAGPGFVLPNAWDAGSARILEQVGFPAIATTSAGIAWSCGVPDGGALDRDTMLEHVGRIVAAVGVPVTADLEAGYGDTADEVGRTVARAVELGAVGGNLEDAGEGGLFGIDEAVDRLAAARAAAPQRHLRAERPH